MTCKLFFNVGLSATLVATSTTHVVAKSLRLIGAVRAEPETVISRAWVQSPDPAE